MAPARLRQEEGAGVGLQQTQEPDASASPRHAQSVLTPTWPRGRAGFPQGAPSPAVSSLNSTSWLFPHGAGGSEAQRGSQASNPPRLKAGARSVRRDYEVTGSCSPRGRHLPEPQPRPSPPSPAEQRLGVPAQTKGWRPAVRGQLRARAETHRQTVAGRVSKAGPGPEGQGVHGRLWLRPQHHRNGPGQPHGWFES